MSNLELLTLINMTHTYKIESTIWHYSCLIAYRLFQIMWILHLYLHCFFSKFLGVKVSVKCAGEKNLAMATTEEDGSFETTVLPSSKSPDSVSCSAKILGATRQLYIPMKASESKVVVKAAGDSDNHHYIMTTSEPLRFYTKCPNPKCIIGGSKTVDLPLPREWGLPPTSYYYLPFIPIIGIP